MYSWGNNNHGQLGVSSDTNVNNPKFVKSLSTVNIILAASSGKHTAVVGTNGYLYTSGSNIYGELGELVNSMM